ncbi:SCO family protein [Piscinibacter sp. XHJ-5]|uniref:SCO family protein n=1 Tax=Piscinibacter sp. XHJ-5 TaxID=3037797 RepID=UPI002453422B|nr:SCO family protein [Piscinibacter sp. XHJ-5]
MTSRRLLITSLAASALLAGCDKLGLTAPANAPKFNGVDITGADYRYALPDTEGRMRTNDDFKGKVTVVFFGYTQCPDVCPTTMAELAQLKKGLGPQGDRLQGVFVTIDPERDTPQTLKSYVGAFDPGFVALRGTPEQTKEVAKAFKVFFAKSPGKTEGSYTMDHTAGSYVFDAQGRVRLFERYGGGIEPLAADVKALLAAG